MHNNINVFIKKLKKDVNGNSVYSVKVIKGINSDITKNFEDIFKVKSTSKGKLNIKWYKTNIIKEIGLYCKEIWSINEILIHEPQEIPYKHII